MVDSFDEDTSRIAEEDVFPSELQNTIQGCAADIEAVTEPGVGFTAGKRS